MQKFPFVALCEIVFWFALEIEQMTRIAVAIGPQIQPAHFLTSMTSLLVGLVCTLRKMR